MKPWISFSSHLLATATSFVVLSVVPVLGWGAFALSRDWAGETGSEPSPLLAVPLASALGAAVFSFVIAPALSAAGQKWTRRFGWSSLSFPFLLGCGATVLLSLANALFGWHLSPEIILGSGAAATVAFGSFWAPLRWAQKVLPRLDAKCGQLRSGVMRGGIEKSRGSVRYPVI